MCSCHRNIDVAADTILQTLVFLAASDNRFNHPSVMHRMPLDLPQPFLQFSIPKRAILTEVNFPVTRRAYRPNMERMVWSTVGYSRCMMRFKVGRAVYLQKRGRRRAKFASTIRPQQYIVSNCLAASVQVATTFGRCTHYLLAGCCC